MIGDMFHWSPASTRSPFMAMTTFVDEALRNPPDPRVAEVAVALCDSSWEVRADTLPATIRLRRP